METVGHVRASFSNISSKRKPSLCNRLFKFTSSRPVLTTRAKSLSVRAEARSEGDDRALWFPGSAPPSYLNGSLAGDYGFDPLGLGSDPSDLKWYVQAELVHARFAMAGVLGVLTTDILRVTGLKDLPVWYEAGAAEYEIADTRVLFAAQLLLFGFVETKRYMDIKYPGSQGEEESFFFFVEKFFSGVEPGYPGGPFFNPFGLASDPSKALPLRAKELTNGRWAMLAALGFAVQAKLTNQSPIENLLAHLADPGHVSIVSTLRDLN